MLTTKYNTFKSTRVKTQNKLYLLCYCALILRVSEVRTRQQRNSAACSTCVSWSCLMATFLPLQPTEYRGGKLESSNSLPQMKLAPQRSAWLLIDCSAKFFFCASINQSAKTAQISMDSDVSL